MTIKTGWKEFFAEKTKELRKTEEYKKASVKDLAPVIAEMWAKENKDNTEIDIHEDEIPDEPKIEVLNKEDIKPIIDEFDYQCSKCGHMFNGKKETCEKCGLVFKYD